MQRINNNNGWACSIFYDNDFLFCRYWENDSFRLITVYCKLERMKMSDRWCTISLYIIILLCNIYITQLIIWGGLPKWWWSVTCEVRTPQKGIPKPTNNEWTKFFQAMPTNLRRKGKESYTILRKIVLAKTWRSHDELWIYERSSLHTHSTSLFLREGLPCSSFPV